MEARLPLYQHHHTSPRILPGILNFCAGAACAAAILLALHPLLRTIRAAALAFGAALS